MGASGVSVPVYTIRSSPPKGFGFIYRITSPSGKAYIGKSCKRVLNRYSDHKSTSRRGRLCPIIWNAIVKYGPDNMRLEVLGCYPKSELSAREQEAIQRYKTRAPNGYNATDGGEGLCGRKHSAETRKKMSEVRTGIVFSPEHLAHIKEASRRRFLCLAEHEKLSKAHKGQRNTAESIAKAAAANTGKKRSAEAKARMSVANKKAWVLRKLRGVLKKQRKEEQTMSKRFSPSSLQPRAHCPCFEYAELTTFDGDTNETMAERGSRLHKAVAEDDLSLCKTDDERQQVQAVIDYEKSIIAGAGTDAIILKEAHLEIPFMDGGTLDFAAVKDKKAWLIDAKFVRTSSVVAPEHNWQLRAYAVGLLLKYPDLEEVVATFLSPAMQYVPEPHTFTKADVEAFVNDVEKIRKSVEDPFKLPATNEYCDQCVHAGRCPALTKIAVAVGARTGLPLPADFAPSIERSPRDRGIMHMLANALEKWAEEAKKMNNEAAANGAEVLGHRLVTRSGGLKIESQQQVIDEIQHAPDGIRVPLTDLLSALSTTPKKLADLVSRVHGLPEKDATERVREWLESSGLAVVAPDVKYLSRVRGADMKQLLEG